MNKICSVLLVLFSIACGAVSADAQSVENNKSVSGKVQPIIISKPTKPGKKHVPSLNICVDACIADGVIEFDIPLEDYPLQVEVELLSEPFGYWSATFSDSFDTEMEINGESGDYKLTITTSEDTTYIGYFNLD